MSYLGFSWGLGAKKNILYFLNGLRHSNHYPGD
jgi:hypothetical protein